MHATAPVSGRARGIVLWAAVLAVFTAAVEGTIVATAMPTIVAHLGGLRSFSWVFAVYFLCQAVTIPIYGRMSDVRGRKPVFFTGIGIFLIGSLLCGFARTMPLLIAFRILQGIGAGGVQSIAATIVGDLFAGNERAKAQSYLSGTWGVAALLGPALGAFLVERVTWSAVFWINVPIGAYCIVAFALALREDRPSRAHRIDVLGSGLLALGVGALIAALVSATQLSRTVIGTLAAAGAVALGALFAHERRTPEPMIPPALWARRIVAIGNAGTFTIGILIMGIAAFLPTYVQGVFGERAFVAGSVLAAMSVSWSAGSFIGGRFLMRSTFRVTTAIGGVLLAGGSAMLIALDPGRGPWWAAAGGIAIGLGFGFSNTSFLIALQGDVERDQRGAATASNFFSRMVGQAVGTALFGAVFNAGVYGGANSGGDTVARVIDPRLRATLAPDDVARLSTTISHALHDVYLVVGLFAAVILALAFAYPAALRPSHQQ